MTSTKHNIALQKLWLLGALKLLAGIPFARPLHQLYCCTAATLSSESQWGCVQTACRCQGCQLCWLGRPPIWVPLVTPLWSWEDIHPPSCKHSKREAMLSCFSTHSCLAGWHSCHKRDRDWSLRPLYGIVQQTRHFLNVSCTRAAGMITTSNSTSPMPSC